MNLVQIVPRLPPVFDGLGDHALQLAKELRQAHEIDTRFIVGDPRWQGSAKVDGFCVDRVKRRAPQELLNLLPPRGTVFLHYVGYGFAQRGCPLWLVNALQVWRADNESRHLVTMFHELYAAGPIWSSSFWNFPLQKLLVAKLANLSDVCRTNRRVSGCLLEKVAAKHTGRISVLPVFSNVGELAQVSALGERAPQMAVFGNPNFRREIFTRHAEALIAACKAMQIECIMDVGKPTALHVELSIPIVETGYLPIAATSKLLANCRAGFLSYFPGYLGKSTIFSGYCAHGLAPVMPAADNLDRDGLRAGEHYLVASDLTAPATLGQMQEIANHALAWYSEHSVAKHAKSLVDSIRGLTTL